MGRKSGVGCGSANATKGIVENTKNDIRGKYIYMVFGSGVGDIRLDERKLHRVARGYLNPHR